MKEGYITRKILSNEEVSEDIYKLRLEGEFKGEPGQFYMLRTSGGLDPFLSRPISIYNLEEEFIEFLYQDIGRGTNLLSRLERGDSLSLLGPLGNGFGEIEGDRIALVSGGIGLAPLVYLAKKLGKKVDFYCGFRSASYEIETIKDYVDKVYIATEDGSFGHKGLVTEIIDYDSYDRLVCCGPRPMMEAVYNLKKELTVSMEERMACGIGACMGCNIKTSKGNKRVCKDGPVFQAKEVFIDA